MSDPKTEKLFRKAVSAVKAKKGRGLVFGTNKPKMQGPWSTYYETGPIENVQIMRAYFNTKKEAVARACSLSLSTKGYVTVNRDGREVESCYDGHLVSPQATKAKKGRGHVFGSTASASDEKRLTIKTDNKWHDFKYRNEVPEKVLKDQFDYQDEDISDNFFKFKGTWYHTDQFMRLEDRNGEMKGWDGYAGDSYFSGVLIKLSSDGERYKVATYYS